MPLQRVLGESLYNLSTILNSSSYTDNSFPTADALYWSSYSYDILKNTKVTWKRAKDNNKNSVFGLGAACYKDVLEGTSIDNNYFIAGLAAVAVYPNYLKSIVNTPDYTSSGVFSVNFFLKGK
jgi:hypothetical protein